MKIAIVSFPRQPFLRVGWGEPEAREYSDGAGEVELVRRINDCGMCVWFGGRWYGPIAKPVNVVERQNVGEN